MSPIERRVTNAIVWLSLLCCAVLSASGVFLMWFYTPEAAKAYGDIQSLHTSVSFGLLVRNIHRWFGHLLYPCLLGLLICGCIGFVRCGQLRSWPIGTLLSLATFLVMPPLLLWVLDSRPNGSLLSGKRFGSELLLDWYVAHLLPVIPAAMAVMFASRARREPKPVE